MNPTANATSGEHPDAVGRGVLGHDADGDATLFVLAGHSLGATAIGGQGTPQWHDLRRLISLDAVGDEADGRLPIEAVFDGGPTLRALWPSPFCEKVVDRLRELLEAGEMIPKGAEAPTTAAGSPSVSEQAPVAGPIEATSSEGAAPSFQPAAGGLTSASSPQPPPLPGGEPAPGRRAAAFSPSPVSVTPGTPGVAPAGPDGPPETAPVMPTTVPTAAPLWAGDDRPMPGDGPPLSSSGSQPGELTLEDVVYHGGYPGQPKRRKKCIAVLDASGLRVSGPTGPEFTVGWELVRQVEAQNSDEAKFRLNIKAKRNSTALVFECDQGVTIVLEAKDVPTLPLRAALHELLDERSVAVA